LVLFGCIDICETHDKPSVDLPAFVDGSNFNGVAVDHPDKPYVLDPEFYLLIGRTTSICLDLGGICVRLVVAVALVPYFSPTLAIRPAVVASIGCRAAGMSVGRCRKKNRYRDTTGGNAKVSKPAGFHPSRVKIISIKTETSLKEYHRQLAEHP